jgi:hypothetical protein
MTKTPLAEQAWAPAVHFLEKYPERWSILRIIHLRETPALWVLVVVPLLFLGMAGLALTCPDTPWLQWGCGLLTLWIIVDNLFVNTSIAYVSRNPRSPFRSVILTMGAFANIALGFAVWYALQATSFTKPLTFVSAIYFSFVTIATVGYGDIAPNSALAQVTVVGEIMAGLYFLAVVLAVVTGWAPGPVDPRGAKGK